MGFYFSCFPQKVSKYSFHCISTLTAAYKICRTFHTFFERAIFSCVASNGGFHLVLQYFLKTGVPRSTNQMQSKTNRALVAYVFSHLKWLLVLTLSFHQLSVVYSFFVLISRCDDIWFCFYETKTNSAHGYRSERICYAN